MPGRIEQHGRRWRVTWQHSGQRFRRSFATRTEAEAFCVELDLERARDSLAQQRRLAPCTVEDVVEAYYQQRKRRLEPSTQYHYEQLIRTHIVPKIGPRSARELADDPAPLQDFYDDLPGTTALHIHQILRPAFQYAVDHRRLERNPCLVAKPARPPKREKLIPSPEEVTKIVTAAYETDPVFGLWVWLISRLALRRGEACALRWEDFDAGRGVVHVRRSISRRKGGTFLKVPKSGETRTLRMPPSFFQKLQPHRRGSGWLFPRGYNAPYVTSTGLSPRSTAGRILRLIHDAGGTFTCPVGRAGTAAAQRIGLRKYSAGPLLRWLEREGHITRRSTGNRTFALTLTDLGGRTVERWSDDPDDGVPVFPTTMDAKFKTLMRALDLPYTPHALRHFVATHMYNRQRDWVQLARFLGHTNPSVTMGLYANHVVEASQLALAETAMDLYDDPLL